MNIYQYFSSTYTAITLFFLLISQVICAQQTTVSQGGIKEKALIDSVTTLPLDSINKWMENNYQENLNEFFDISQFALKQLLATGNDSLIADCYEDISSWYAYNGEYSIDSTVVNQEKALLYYEKAGQNELAASTKMNLAIDYRNAGKADDAQKVLFEAIDYFENSGEENKIAGCYRIVAILATDEKRYEKAIEYADKALVVFRKVEDYYKIGLSNFIKLDALVKLERYDEALAAANEAMEIGKNNIPDETFFVTRTYEYRGEVYFKKGEYDLALKDLNEGYRLMVDAVGEERAEVNKLMIGNTLCKMGKYQEGIKNMEIGLNISGIKGQSMVKDLYKDLSECYEKVGDFANAHRNFKVYERLDKETLNNKVKNLEEEAVIKYETAKKDEEIALQEFQLEQKSKIQYLYLGIASLLGVMLLSLLFFFRKNRKNNALLSKKNRENELLLKEIHHRVKNNLQTISSLLSLQSASISDPAALDAVQESKNRVASMALIHQKLYQGENLAAVEMKDYFSTIGNNIINSFGTIAKDIDLKIDMPEIELDVDTAVPIGLITNELVTNSIKYAFPATHKGTISISLDRDKDGLFKLSVSDDGLADNNLKTSTGFGTMLIDLLTRQLGGKIETIRDSGTTTLIDFTLQQKSVA